MKKPRNLHPVRQVSDEEFRVILAKYKPIVLALARLAAQRGFDFEDALQEASIRLWISSMYFKEGGEAKFSTYAYPAIRRRVWCLATQEQKHWRSKRIPLELEICQGDLKLRDTILNSLAPDPAQEASSAEILEICQNYIASLKPKRKRVMDLILQGYNFTEVASKTGMTDLGVGLIYHRVVSKLRTKLEHPARKT